MQIIGMEDISIAIQKIQDITSIRLDSFVYDDVSSKKLEVVPYLIVTYGEKEELALSSKQKYFDLFVKKVTEVYENEKNNIIEDSLTDAFRLRSHISIDEHTKEILESGALLDKNSLYYFYDDKFSYEDSLMFNKDKFKLIFPVIKYHIEDFFSRTKTSVSFDGEFKGYTNRYITTANVEGINKIVNVSIIESADNVYSIVIGGLLIHNNSIDMTISFEKNRIHVVINNKKDNFMADYSYLANNETVRKILEIKIGDNPIVIEKDNLEETDNIHENITDLDSKSNFRWFVLPWNAIYGINNNLEEMSETEKMIQAYSMYVFVSDDAFMKKEIYSKTYMRNNTTAVKSDGVTISEMLKNTLCVCISKDDNLYVIETAFLSPLNATGYYQEKLADRFFYHVVRSENGIEGILLSDGINVNKNSVISKGDLRDSSRILRVMKGE